MTNPPTSLPPFGTIQLPHSVQVHNLEVILDDRLSFETPRCPQHHQDLLSIAYIASAQANPLTSLNAEKIVNSLKKLAHMQHCAARTVLLTHHHYHPTRRHIIAVINLAPPFLTRCLQDTFFCIQKKAVHRTAPGYLRELKFRPSTPARSLRSASILPFHQSRCSVPRLWNALPEGSYPTFKREHAGAHTQRLSD